MIAEYFSRLKIQPCTTTWNGLYNYYIVRARTIQPTKALTK